MKKSLRKKIYIDRVFQKKFLSVFLCFLLVNSISSLFFYWFFLDRQIEKELYRSHFKISNLNDLLLKELCNLNIFLVTLSLLAIPLIYLFLKVEIKSLFRQIKKLLENLHNGQINDINPEFLQITRVFASFEDLKGSLTDFLKANSAQAEKRKLFLDLLGKYINNKGPEIRTRLLELTAIKETEHNYNKTNQEK